MRRNPLVAGILAVVFLLALALLFVLPQGSKVEAAQADLASAEAELAGLRSELAQLQSFAASGDLPRQLAAARTQIPATPDLEALLADLEGAALRSGVILTSISPGVPAAGAAGTLSALNLTLAATGPYFSLARFIFELEHLERLTRVDTFSVAGSGNDLSLQVGAVVFTTDPNAGPGSDPAPGPEVGA